MRSSSIWTVTCRRTGDRDTSFTRNACRARPMARSTALPSSAWQFNTPAHPQTSSWCAQEESKRHRCMIPLYSSVSRHQRLRFRESSTGYVSANRRSRARHCEPSIAAAGLHAANRRRVRKLGRIHTALCDQGIGTSLPDLRRSSIKSRPAVMAAHATSVPRHSSSHGAESRS